MDLTETEEIKKRWQEYEDLNDLMILMDTKKILMIQITMMV